MSSSYQTQYYSQQPDNNNLGLLTTGALAGGGIATLAALRFMKKGKILQDLSQKGRDANIDAMAGKKYPVNKETKKTSVAAMAKAAEKELKEKGIDINDTDALLRMGISEAQRMAGVTSPLNRFSSQNIASIGSVPANPGSVLTDLDVLKKQLYSRQPQYGKEDKIGQSVARLESPLLDPNSPAYTGKYSQNSTKKTQYKRS